MNCGSRIHTLNLFQGVSSAPRPECPKCRAYMTKLSEITKPYKEGYRWVCTKCGRMIKLSGCETLYDKFAEKLRSKNREELLNILRKEVLDYDEDNYLTESEWNQLAEFWGAHVALTFKRKKARENGDFEAVKALSKTIKELRKRYELLLLKEDRDAKMRELRNRWKRFENFGTFQIIRNEELIEAIVEMRLLRMIDLPFDYERYMQTLFKGRQKGRAYKTFYER